LGAILTGIANREVIKALPTTSLKDPEFVIKKAANPRPA
jgi:hypothetical protein